MRRLAGFVHVDGRVFGPEDEVPSDVAGRITNPKAWVAGEVAESSEGESEEPPRSGKGSGLEAWKAYAEGLDIVVPDDASRDDVIALVDSAKG
jgi:hypothetical protein